MKNLQYIMLLTFFIFMACESSEPKIGYCGTEDIEEVRSLKRLKGYSIYEIKCAPCHAIDANIVGTALSEIVLNKEINWIVKFIQDSQQVKLKHHVEEEAEKFILHPPVNINDAEIDSFKYFLEEIKIAFTDTAEQKK